ncbi:MAG: threonine/serine exporter family protein [Ignavibacteria bacterium]
MSVSDILIIGMWSAFFATSMCILNSTPFKYIIPTFICGFAGVLTRDFLQNAGLSVNWATLTAAFTIVILAGIIIRSQNVPPIVLICAVLPQWASVSMFQMLNDLRRVTVLTGDELSKAAVDLTANTAMVFVISLVIAIGFALGLAVLKFVYREESKEEKAFGLE